GKPSGRCVLERRSRAELALRNEPRAQQADARKPAIEKGTRGNPAGHQARRCRATTACRRSAAFAACGKTQGCQGRCGDPRRGRPTGKQAKGFTMSEVMDWLRDERRFADFLTGRDPSPREMGEQFLRLSPNQRAMKLNELGRKLSESN